MANDNRARRAAKQRQRDARRASQQAEKPSAEAPTLAQLLAAAARDTSDGDPAAAEQAAFAAFASPEISTPRQVQQILTELLVDALGWNWRGGWQPVDLLETAQRELTREHVGLLRFVLVEAMKPHPSATTHPRWSEQLDDLTWPAGSNALEAWQRTERKDPVWPVQLGLEVLALLMKVPKLEVLLPLPGTYRPGAKSEGVDQRVLAKVRGLLAKAESTEYDEEAEALSAKAQELMTRYSLDHLTVHAISEPVASARRLWLPSPYASAKALLAAAVGEANRCKVVWTEYLGFVTVIGDEPDLAATELMVTSLLVQAARAMLHAKPAAGDKRTFRQSFLVAYAQRIGERLLDASEHVAAEVGGAALVPVLAAQRERVERTREQMFPTLRSKSVSVRSEHGYLAGRAAADQAVLEGPRAVR